MMEKLVRDKMPELCEQNAINVHGWTPMTYRIATADELGWFLREKLQEETTETIIAHASLDINATVSEMGDVLDVIDAMCLHFGISRDQVDYARKRKTEARGGFSKGIIWDGQY